MIRPPELLLLRIKKFNSNSCGIQKSVVLSRSAFCGCLLKLIDADCVCMLFYAFSLYSICYALIIDISAVYDCHISFLRFNLIINTCLRVLAIAEARNIRCDDVVTTNNVCRHGWIFVICPPLVSAASTCPCVCDVYVYAPVHICVCMIEYLRLHVSVCVCAWVCGAPACSFVCACTCVHICLRVC